MFLAALTEQAQVHQFSNHIHADGSGIGACVAQQEHNFFLVFRELGHR